MRQHFRCKIVANLLAKGGLPLRAARAVPPIQPSIWSLAGAADGFWRLDVDGPAAKKK